MVDGLPISIWNKAKKPLVIALSGAVCRLGGRDDGGNIITVQYKPNPNCHFESPPCVMNIY
jgi:hypothetical protein